MVNIITEHAFSSSYWCSQYLRGIKHEAKRKNIQINITEDIRDIKNHSKESNVAILIGTSLPWLYDTVSSLREFGVRAVILSAQKRQNLGCGVSYVTMDYEDALEKLMYYFNKIGRRKAALFAINPDSATDQNKRMAFLRSESNSEEDIYYFNATLEDACRSLYDNIEKYDAVICANNISGIVLSKFLREQNISIPADIHIAEFGDFSEHIQSEGRTLIRIKAVEAGKLAIRCVRLLFGHPELSSVSLNVKCDIVTENGIIDFSNEELKSSDFISKPEPQKELRDEHISNALMHEKILCMCDRVDIEILKSIIAHESYSKIAVKSHISENTIGYRIKRLMQFAPTATKEEMINALKPYLD